MANTLRLNSRDDVKAALESPVLVPPPPPSNLESGATANLRSAMARFRNGEAHRQPRRDVVELIDHIDVEAVEATAHQSTLVRLGSSRIEAVTGLAEQVPTAALARVLAVPESDIPMVIDDVKAMVEVIGRGADSTSESDEAVTRILEIFAGENSDPVAKASLLYQNHDATSALTSATILAHGSQEQRHSAVKTTARVALTDTVVAGHLVAKGSTVILDLEAAKLEFGFGPHRCPGSELAEAMVSGITKALEHSKFQLRLHEVELSADGRPLKLPMERIQ